MKAQGGQRLDDREGPGQWVSHSWMVPLGGLLGSLRDCCSGERVRQGEHWKLRQYPGEVMRLERELSSFISYPFELKC